MGAALWIDGEFDAAAARAALEDVARRQASLRTVFGEGPDGVPFQRVEEMPAIAFETADLGRTACSERDDAVRERLAALQSRPFDLLQGPPWRVALLAWMRARMCSPW